MNFAVRCPTTACPHVSPCRGGVCPGGFPRVIIVAPLDPKIMNDRDNHHKLATNDTPGFFYPPSWSWPIQNLQAWDCKFPPCPPGGELVLQEKIWASIMRRFMGHLSSTSGWAQLDRKVCLQNLVFSPPKKENPHCESNFPAFPPCRHCAKTTQREERNQIDNVPSEAGVCKKKWTKLQRRRSFFLLQCICLEAQTIIWEFLFTTHCLVTFFRYIYIIHN